MSNVAPKNRSRHIYSFPFFVSFWDLRLGWGSSGNLATRDSGKVGALYQDHQRQILLQLNLNKWCISLCKDFCCALNPLAGSFPTQLTRRRPFLWQLWSQASGRREEGKLEMSQNKSCWTFLIQVFQSFIHNSDRLYEMVPAHYWTTCDRGKSNLVLKFWFVIAWT